MNYIDYFSSFQELYQRILLPISEKYSLSSMELTILLFLANNPEYDTAAEIVRKRHLSKSHVSTSIHSLEEKGLLVKELRDGNRRSEHLVLCRKSRDIIKKGQDAQNLFLETLCAGISDDQKRDIICGLQKMNENVLQALVEVKK
ncbi:MAG: MarR family transcriptional regulator [Lachnospiraceae bacterium]|nr:MarR family transcriptional regulator [Lachnospiraceae bacterium]